ncbi:DHH family phosphoesterase [Ligilactobacillus salivarius]|uniref:DHH family phosphoesterase n=1 Tax=Ligilactobacillus salivarius TaxID=1624 RepID=UPI001CC0C669|nr:DHH family phosphoesterase [Ligilactobacillus salivarius]MBZ4025572.1 DHH family phosphoesterase [Ligilactobacillus salivarius]MBZ4030803.1 DHH family phosphoesterase [Ligilactobacillus salivarius]MBZ4032263.1 DHH family phosphoesterase [Ligilactobacillus salivarius]
MKRLLEKEFWQIPEFLRNKHLRIIAVFLLILSLICATLAFIVNAWLGIIVLLLILLTIGLSFMTLKQVMQDTTHYISDLSYKIKRSEQEALLKMPIGILMLNDLAEVVWVNPTMQKLFGQEEILGKKLTEADEELAKVINDNMSNKDSVEIKWQDKRFNMLVQSDINVVYLLDITHYAEIQKQYDDSRLVIGQIFIDNYDEVTQSMNDTNISNLSNYITNELSSWASQMGMFLKMIDEDHYFVLAYTKSLTQMEKEKFKLLDRIRERTSKQNFPVTLSIGLAYGGTNLAKLSRLSQSNLDLALGRGGDQVVVRGVDDSQARFYGGKTNPMEKRTRVRARMISQALQELMSQSDDIFVMGHARPDMDSIGACLGIRRIAKMNGKQCWLVLDTDNLHSDIQRLLDEIDNYPDIKESIISPEEALQKATKKSLLLMLDLSKPSISMSPELYDQLKNRVIIIDHHRRGEEFPENPMLVYIEPYASSTCELITEMFEYQSRYSDDPINKLEATAMLTGIIIDTKSFSLRTGTRTFDAASYLRSVGADSQMSQHFMKENVQSFLQRNHLIDRVEFVGNGNAVVVGENDRAYDPVTAAQAADSLLTVSGVQASYVVTHRSEDIIGISARSNGETNVQIIMEKMGGGGHLSNAATQIEDRDILDVRKQLLDLIAQTEENNTEETD